MSRDLAVVVLGATGVTGRRVAAYLAARCEEDGIAWAAAGRDPERVASTLGELGVVAPETIAADVADPDSLREMASRTRVVLDMVGPYTLYGRPVIEACIAAGSHYADLTGEIPFVRRTIDDLDGAAREAGVKVVNVSGFEALPPDLCVLLAAEAARERWDEGLENVDVDVTLPTPERGDNFADLLSGGTMQSIAEMLDDEDAALIPDPAALIPDPDAAARVRAKSPIALAPRFDPEGRAIAPMVPSAFINPAVIHRTAALVAAEEGRPHAPFRYREGIALPGNGAVSAPFRHLAAAALGGSQAAFAALTKAQPGLRGRAARAARRWLPKSGFGPQGERMEDWSWSLAVRARTASGNFVHVELDGDGQPGYLTTARMLGEAGLLLSEQGATPDRSGQLTPATALGTVGLDRFARAGARIRLAS